MPAVRYTKKALTDAIDAHCKGCIYDNHVEGTWVAQVKACTAKECELYAFRRGARSQIGKEEEE